MVLGYYDTHGFPDLFNGDASTQTADVSQGIASQGSGVRGSGQQRHYEDYSLPDDTGQASVIPDSSTGYPGGCHADNCVADYMHTSWSRDGNFYGWSWSDKIAPAFTSYVTLKNPSYQPQCTQYYMGSTLTWSVLTNEIGHNRPMVFLVDSDGNGSTDHFVTIVAYTDSPTQQYGCLDTWGTCTQIRWCQFRPMSSSYAWGVWGGWSFTINNPQTTAILTVASSNPSSGVSITVSPNDNNGQGDGSTQFTRTYNINTIVTLTAPSTASGSNFQKWRRNGADWSTSTSINVTMDANYTLSAVYVTPPPVASFTGNPTFGGAPLTVTFTDMSTGNITGRSWIFGDGGKTDTTTNSVVHTYGLGTYTVTQIETGPGGVTTNTRPNYITVVTPFQAWQVQYFGSTNNPNAAPTADADGTGQNNLFKFLAGLDPTNPASIFQITAVSREGDGLRVTWSCVGGHTYALQGTVRVAAGGYTNNFFDISPAITVSGAGGATTNFLLTGALTSPGSAAPSGPVVPSVPQSPSMALTVEASAWNTRGIADAYGNALPVSNLVMFGTFSIDEPTIQSEFQAGEIGSIMSAFTPCGASFAVGDGTDVPATWGIDVDGTSFIGQQMYIVVADRPTVEEASQLGIFTGPTWVLPSDQTFTNIDLETATDFVVGAPGGSLTIDWGDPYTFTDTAQLAPVPMVSRFYRVRLVP